MTLEEAKKIVPENYSVHGDVTTALRVLAAAIGEPTPEDRADAAAWRARAESHYFPPGIQGGEWEDEAAMYRRAAEALGRSPAAIRRAAIEEAAELADGYVGLSDEAEHIAAAVRALADEAPRGQ